VHQLGGYRQQGRTDEEAKRLRKEALALQAAGASLLVLECIPSDLSTHITHLLHIPTIGIGAGPACDGQVLVLYDMLGISPRSPSFSKNFLLGQESIQSAILHFVKSVKAGNFPS
jgi:3-methyl-2-oxobutanoate hydroxymethyltransferase